MRLACIWVVLLAGAAICRAEPGTRGPSAPRVVWSGPGVTLLGGPSPDGRFLSYVEPGSGSLALYELETGRTRELAARPPGTSQFAYFSAVAPDSRRVAYAWFNQEGFYDLRVVDIETRQPRVLYSNEEAGFVQPCAWTPDGKQILTLFFRSDNISQIALVPAAGGPMKVLRSLNWVYPKRMDLSPDGRFIVYDSFAREGAADRTLFLLAADGSRETRLLEEPGNHLFPLWTPDGRHVVYASDQSGTMDAWVLRIEDGAPAGKARLLSRDLGRFLPLGIARTGQYFFGVRSGSSDVFVTTFSDPAADARRATERFPGRNSAPAWAPDGNALAYLSRRGSENFGEEARAIVIRTLAPDGEREVLPPLAHLERVRWAPDGKSLVVSGSTDKGRGGIYGVDPGSGGIRPLVEEAGAPFRGFDGALARDNSTLFYLKGGELRRRDLETGTDTAIWHGRDPRHLALAPQGDAVAVIASGGAVFLVPAAGGDARRLPFEGAVELDWNRDLVVGKGAGLWRLPLDGAPAERLKTPGNRQPGFSLHPDGKRLAVTAGNARSEVRLIDLGDL